MLVPDYFFDPMPLESLIRYWQRDEATAPNITTWRVTPARPADLYPFPDDLPLVLKESLRARGIASLYSHQSAAWTHARAGENLVLATGTASGKTLAYNLPVLAALLEDDRARALYLFPTKALAQDQLSVISNQLSVISNQLSVISDQLSVISDQSGTAHGPLNVGIYDGDTPQGQRAQIRGNARIILSNPDMLHTGILPHHANWAVFFGNLKYIVIDEMHTYRGVFGAHVANVIRRLKRVAAFHGATPCFILASATIANPAELAGRLIESPVTLIDQDGSGRGEKHFAIYNPPVVDESLGLRKSSLHEAVRLAQDLLRAEVQSVVFARSRRSVELLLSQLQGNQNRNDEKRLMENGKTHDPLTIDQPSIRGYRSGYLPAQRREIEKGLRDGSVRLVVATNALELGIDIGGLDAAILVGYPGTVASTRQQAGRAGRGDAPALALMIASAAPLDQFLARHPEFIFDRSPEQALTDPDHLLILLNHLRCALFELPFQKGEGFGKLSGQQVEEFLQFLVDNREAHFSNEKYFWMADAYPAASVSLRSASPETVLLHADDGGEARVIGEVDIESAAWMVHPRALYLHEGQQYFVQELNLEKRTAVLIPVALDYYTEPLRETSIQVINVKQTHIATRTSHIKAWGELQVTTRVTGFRKRSWAGENLGQEELDLPPSELQTTGYWISISDETIAALSQDGLWTNAPNDYGPDWSQIRKRVRARDDFRCQVCGRSESTREHDVHHKIPFRMFLRSATSPDVAAQSLETLRSRANQPDNLITLCPECHHKAETNVRVRSGLAGLGYVLSQLAPLFLMCDTGDLGLHSEPTEAVFGHPSIVLYDQIPAGIGFSQKLFDLSEELIARALQLVSECACADGCPSCVGAAGENGMGGKQETLAMLKLL
jgi:DEAD/DEAH box helicase domain-containing protein